MIDEEFTFGAHCGRGVERAKHHVETRQIAVGDGRALAVEPGLSEGVSEG